MSLVAIQEFIGYVKIERRYSPHTCISYENDLSQFQLFVKEMYEVEDILMVNHQVVRAWVVQLMTEEKKSTSVNRKISTLRSFYNWATRKKKITFNPMLKVIAPKKPKKLPEVIPGNNIMRLFETSLAEVAKQNPFESIRDTFIIELFYATGIRRAELVQLKMVDINESRKEIRVLGKGNKVRSIPLTENILMAFTSYREARETILGISTDFVFVTSKGKPIYEKLVYNIVRRKLNEITTLSKKSPHVLRHTFATHLLDEGADLNAIKEMLGHASLAATQVYTHNSITKLKDVYKKAHPEG